jgi:predicted acetyltransferase
LSPLLQYRFARSDEIDDIARLIAHSFPGPTRPPEWWREQLAEPAYGGGPDTLFIGMDGARAAAALQIHPLRQWIAGELMECAGIGSVAASPTHRRRGIGAELVTEALRAAHERGDVLSALYPFRTSFYQQLGYGHSGEVMQYQIAPGLLPDAPERLRVETLDSGTMRAEALALYGRWARTQNGQLERGERLWRQLTSGADTVLVGYRAGSGELEGYALAGYRTDLPAPQRCVEIDELVWTSPDAQRGLLGWIASLGDQWPYAVVRALPAHRLLDRVREPRLPAGSALNWRLWAPAATLLTGTMSRILDVSAAWQRRRVSGGADTAYALEVTDAQIDANRGLWRLSFADGSAHIERGGDAPCTLRLDISTLSRLHTSAITATGALHAGLLECDRPELLAPLDAVLALPEPWTFDRF